MKKRQCDLENPKNQKLEIRLNPDEKEAIKRYCSAYNMTMAELFRERLSDVLVA